MYATFNARARSFNKLTANANWFKRKAEDDDIKDEMRKEDNIPKGGISQDENSSRKDAPKGWKSGKGRIKRINNRARRRFKAAKGIKVADNTPLPTIAVLFVDQTQGGQTPTSRGQAGKNYRV